MRTLILTAAALIAGLAMSQQATAADRSHHQPSISHGATLSLVGHHYSRPGHSLHGDRGYRGYHGYHGYHGYRSYYPPRHGCERPLYVHPPIYHPPVVVPYPPVVHPPVYHHRYYRHGYHQGGLSINTGRVGFSIAF